MLCALWNCTHILVLISWIFVIKLLDSFLDVHQTVVFPLFPTPHSSGLEIPQIIGDLPCNIMKIMSILYIVYLSMFAYNTIPMSDIRSETGPVSIIRVREYDPHVKTSKRNGPDVNYSFSAWIASIPSVFKLWPVLMWKGILNARNIYGHAFSEVFSHFMLGGKSLELEPQAQLFFIFCCWNKIIFPK